MKFLRGHRLAPYDFRMVLSRRHSSRAERLALSRRSRVARAGTCGSRFSLWKDNAITVFRSAFGIERRSWSVSSETEATIGSRISRPLHPADGELRRTECPPSAFASVASADMLPSFTSVRPGVVTIGIAEWKWKCRRARATGTPCAVLSGVRWLLSDDGLGFDRRAQQGRAVRPGRSSPCWTYHGPPPSLKFRRSCFRPRFRR
jgi:hypothetical protein